MTQLEYALKGEITEIMRNAAEFEGILPEVLMKSIAQGKTIIPANINRKRKEYRAIGECCKVKVNANIGTSRDITSVDEELKKMVIAEKAGADAIMDLSTGGDLDSIRQKILDLSTVMIGTVPIYDAAAKAIDSNGSILEFTSDDLLNSVKRHAEQGVDFVTVHCGVTRGIAKKYKLRERIGGVVSRGGSLTLTWMEKKDQENPLFEHFDKMLEICKKYDVTLSLGDGLRPGALADSFDPPQVEELVILANLAKRAREAGVQVMIEGPGHVPMDQVEAQVKLQKSLCDGAPFYVLGPLVTDIAPGYDHIVGAIGGAIAAKAGADFLCYVTPAEHLGLPTGEDVKAGVIASRIAGHAADLARGFPGAYERNLNFSKYRKLRNWNEMFARCIDPERARVVKKNLASKDDNVCSMCSEFCSLRVQEEEN